MKGTTFSAILSKSLNQSKLFIKKLGSITLREQICNFRYIRDFK